MAYRNETYTNGSGTVFPGMLLGFNVSSCKCSTDGGSGGTQIWCLK